MLAGFEPLRLLQSSCLDYKHTLLCPDDSNEGLPTAQQVAYLLLFRQGLAIQPGLAWNSLPSSHSLSAGIQKNTTPS